MYYLFVSEGVGSAWSSAIANSSSKRRPSHSAPDALATWLNSIRLLYPSWLHSLKHSRHSWSRATPRAGSSRPCSRHDSSADAADCLKSESIFVVPSVWERSIRDRNIVMNRSLAKIESRWNVNNPFINVSLGRPVNAWHDQVFFLYLKKPIIIIIIFVVDDFLYSIYAKNHLKSVVHIFFKLSLNFGSAPATNHR